MAATWLPPLVAPGRSAGASTSSAALRLSVSSTIKSDALPISSDALKCSRFGTPPWKRVSVRTTKALLGRSSGFRPMTQSRRTTSTFSGLEVGLCRPVEDGGLLEPGTDAGRASRSVKAVMDPARSARASSVV